MFKLVDVSKYYNSNGIITIALEHINLEFNKGDIVAITGESGSGKSTLLNIICANDSYDEGEIYFYGNETSYFDLTDQDNFRNKYVGFIYQNYNIIDSYTVLQNVMFPLLIKGMKHKEAKARALELIEKVGLKNRIKHKGTKLSGGEKQRVVIARALASDPEILACDEPTGNLDSKTAKEIIDLIKEVAKDKLVLIVTHNYEQVKDIATRKVTLVDGHIIEDKVLKEVSSDTPKAMDLTRQKVSFKNIAYFTKNNILSTPRKTIFISFVMFIMCFAILSLFQGLNWSYLENTPISKDNVITYEPNYIVVNRKDGTPINPNDFMNLDTYYVDFYQDMKYCLQIASYMQNVKFSPVLPEYTNLIGREPVNETECLLLLPEDTPTVTVTKYMGCAIVNSSKLIETHIVGIANTKYINHPSIYMTENITKALMDTYIKEYISCDLKGYPYKPVTISTRMANIDKMVLTLPYELVDYEEVIIYYNDIYRLNMDFDIIYVNSVNPVLYIPADFVREDFPFYEVGLYCNNVSQVSKELTKLGYNVYSPYDNATRSTETVLVLIILTLVCVIPIIFIYIITYLIFRIVYVSKFKEYTIMRIIGIDKKNMSKMLMLETFGVSILTSIFAFLIGIILGVGLGISIYTTINAYITIIFFAIMLFFSLFLSLRLNKRLFRYSTSKMLKAGD